MINKYNLQQLIEHCDLSVENAKNGKSKLTKDILNIQGMTGVKTKHLYNNICDLDGANYLEVGTYTGSSFISSLYLNNINSIAVDNWSEFNGPRGQFFSNMSTFLPSKKYNFIEKNCFDVDHNDINSIFDSVDIYLYDGSHDFESHKRAITHYSKFLSKYSIIIIDDWRDDTVSWEQVSKGTYDGLSDSNLVVHHKIEVISKQEENGSYEFWNGFAIFVVEKKTK